MSQALIEENVIETTLTSQKALSVGLSDKILEFVLI